MSKVGLSTAGKWLDNCVPRLIYQPAAAMVSGAAPAGGAPRHTTLLFTDLAGTQSRRSWPDTRRDRQTAAAGKAGCRGKCNTSPQHGLCLSLGPCPAVCEINLDTGRADCPARLLLFCTLSWLCQYTLVTMPFSNCQYVEMLLIFLFPTM